MRLARELARMGSCRLEPRSPLRSDGRLRPTRFGLSGRSGVTPCELLATLTAAPQSRAVARSSSGRLRLLWWHVGDEIAASEVDSLPVGQRIGGFGSVLAESSPWRQRFDAVDGQRVGNVLWGQIERAGGELLSVARSAAGAALPGSAA